MPTGQTAEERKDAIDGISKEADLAKQDLTPTPLSEWGKKKVVVDNGFIVELPSGYVARIKRTMDMLTMLQAGKIPNPLAKIVNQMIEGGEKDITKLAKESENPEILRQMFDLVNSTMPKVFVEPAVSAPEPRQQGEEWDAYMARLNAWEPDEGTLSVFEIDMEDKVYVFAVAQGAAADLARFRAEQESALGAVQAEQPVVKPTKRTGGGRSKK